MLTIDRLIADLVDAARSSGATKTRIAVQSKLHPNTLRRFGEVGWNPAVSTMRRLERALLPGSSDAPKRSNPSRSRK